MGKKGTILALLFETLYKAQAVLSSVQMLRKYTHSKFGPLEGFIWLFLNDTDKCQHSCVTQCTCVCATVTYVQVNWFYFLHKLSFHPGITFPVTQRQIRKCVKWISAQKTKLYIYSWKNMGTHCLKKRGINYRGTQAHLNLHVELHHLYKYSLHY